MKKFYNLRFKIILIYFILAIIPIYLVCFISYYTFEKHTNNIENNLLDYAILQTSENLSEKLANYRNVITQVATNVDIINLYKQFYTSEPFSNETASARNKLNSQFSLYVQGDNYINSIVLITNSLDIAYYDRTENSFYGTRWENRDFRENFIAYGNEADRNSINVISAVGFKGAPDNANKYTYFTYPAIDTITKASYGVLVMEVDNQIFNSVINIKNNTSFLDTNISPSSFIANSKGIVITSPNLGLIGSKADDNIKSNSNNVTYKSVPIKGTLLNLFIVFQKNAFQKYKDGYRNFVIILTLIITLCFTFIVFIMTGRLWKKTKEITFAIKRFRKNQEDVNVEIDEHDEILFSIADQFNKMTTEINNLVAELKEKNENIARVMDQRRKAEIKALQAQINPHFIYNALDRINWIAIDNEQYKISEMLSGLASLLRYSISNIDMLVPLRAEIEWMKKYLIIQSTRFNISINFITAINGDAIDFPIYKMLLQPLVENSVLHGFVYEQNDCRIELIANILDDGRLKIILRDNGTGMDSETLDRINSLISDNNLFETENIGINNVINRLRLYYDTEFKIKVASELNKGTSFTLVIPYKHQL